MTDKHKRVAEPGGEARGYAAALSAYAIWGLVLPLFMKALATVSPFEVVAHRVIWALPFAILVLAWFGALKSLRPYLTARMLALAALCACTISVNWGVYVYAIGSGQGLAAAFGYYINPLVSLVLGAVVLGEKLGPRRMAAVALAAVGVAILAVASGGIPWISLVLASSFALYGLLRKMTPYGATHGFFLEVAILFVPAVLIAANAQGEGFGQSAWITGLLIAAGPLTAIPLILYATGARLLPLSTVGILQYIVPTLLALTSVLLFGETFGAAQLVSFGFIWAGLGFYTASLLREGRARRAPPPVPPRDQAY